MFVEISNEMESVTIKSKQHITYNMKKLLKQLFKQRKSQKLAHLQNLENAKLAESFDSSLESLENSRNASMEEDSASLESYENDMNERLTSEIITYVPVHFVRTEHGTFFWTAGNDMPICQQDRWAQA